MENVKYYKDLSHNYLIIKDTVWGEQNSYQHKMITTNKMKHLLACKIRHVNQECHFYYEISSRQSIMSLFDKRKMDYEQIRHLFECMKEALTELDNYLLNSRCLVLQPEYIFGNPETEEYFFLYYPDNLYEMGEKLEGRHMPLVEFLVEKVNPEQEEAVNIVYKIYEMVQDNRFILSEIMGLFTEKVPEVRERVEEIISRKEEKEDTIQDDMNFFRKQEEWEANTKEDAPKHLIAAGILAFACMAAAAGVFGIRYFFVLSMEETILSMAGSIALIIMSALLFLYLIFNFYGRKRQGKGEKDTDAAEERKYADTGNTSDLSGFYPKDTVYQGVFERQSKDLEEAEYGNTVFLEAAVCKTEHKLYGTNKGNKYHIDLEQLPCTVGKMAGSVDVVIKDNTVSRIHARFTRQEEGVCVTDMNSTNGTFKNGLRLEPNETVLIEQGDELRFGRMTFCYR